VSIFPTRILLATDGSKEAELAATTTVGLTKTTGSGLHVFNVEGARDVLGEQVKKMENLGGAVARGHARTGDVAKEVLNLAEERGASLIVMGSRGKGRIKRLAIGDVSDWVVRVVHCPVFMAHG
jgi:nucleotide-binding universal stress UspA family protein